jgi:hypothetical protein
MFWKHPIDPPKDLFDLKKIEIISIYGGGHTVRLEFAPNDDKSDVPPFDIKFSRKTAQSALELAKYYQKKYAKTVGD